MSPTAVTPVAPPSIRLALLDYHSSNTCLLVNGQSSKEYTFTYDPTVQMFVYRTTSQEDVNDLCRINGVYNFFVIVPLIELPEAATTATVNSQQVPVTLAPAPEPARQQAESPTAPPQPAAPRSFIQRLTGKSGK